jgi:D-alanine-D-alanine ligase
MPKQVLVIFGGISAEHEVSVITGLQAVENIDTEKYLPLALYIDKNGSFYCIPTLKTRRGFLTAPRKSATFGKDTQGGFITMDGWHKKKIYPHAAYLAMHGGSGESGPLQGLLEMVDIPFTSPGQESSVLMMNKQLTKDVLAKENIETVQGISIFATEIKKNLENLTSKIIQELTLPVIIKPVHLGSSIGINIARTEVELKKFLLEASQVDNEILVEKFLTSFKEYNCSVRLIHGVIEASEIERPMSKDEILSFADKYERGGKKSGSGMASLQRELPAKIDDRLKQEIQMIAKMAFLACRGKGMVRIDFMVTPEEKIYLTEINPIPGSMAFYLWEASGISFREQISDLIEQSVVDAELERTSRLDYESNIVEKFTSQSNQ